jgi:hypothetical protein
MVKKDMPFDKASKGIGTGIGIAAMGIGMGIAFDMMRDVKTTSKKKNKSIQPFPTIKPLKWK